MDLRLFYSHVTICLSAKKKAVSHIYFRTAFAELFRVVPQKNHSEKYLCLRYPFLLAFIIKGKVFKFVNSKSCHQIEGT